MAEQELKVGVKYKSGISTFILKGEKVETSLGVYYYMADIETDGKKFEDKIYIGSEMWWRAVELKHKRDVVGEFEVNGETYQLVRSYHY